MNEINKELLTILSNLVKSIDNLANKIKPEKNKLYLNLNQL